MSAYALDALSADARLLTDVSILVVDGFDNFTPSQFQTLQVVGGRAAETWITLPGTPEMARISLRRSAGDFKILAANQALDIQTLPHPPFLPPTLRRLEAVLFEKLSQPLRSGADLTRIEARSPGGGSTRSSALDQSPRRTRRPGAFRLCNCRPGVRNLPAPRSRIRPMSLVYPSISPMGPCFQATLWALPFWIS